MEADRFRELMEEAHGRVKAMVQTKGKDYAGAEFDDEILSNFKRHAAELGLEPEQIWAVYASKHWDAILSAVRGLGDDGYQPSEPVAGRVLDLVLYLYLFLGLQEDRAAIAGQDRVDMSDDGDGDPTREMPRG